MLESDWKKISKMLPFLRERYLVDQNARFVRMLTEPGKEDTDRFWDTLKEMKQQSKILVQCLDARVPTWKSTWCRCSMSAC